MKKIVSTFILLFVLVNPCLAKECSKIEAYAAETVIDYLSTWREVYNAFDQFGHCDDAAIAEGFDDRISLLWADHWEQLPEMINLVKSSSQFGNFVTKRVGSETIPSERWKRIVHQAETNCPSIAEQFCRSIIDVK